MSTSSALLLAAGAALVGVALGVLATLPSRRRSLQAVEQELRRTVSTLEDHERAARDDRQVQATILSTMQEGTLLFDPDGRTAFASDAVVRLLGGRPASLGQLYPPSLRESVRQVSGTRLIDAVEIETGSPARWLRIVAAPAGDDGSVLLVVTDATESRRIDAVRRDFVANASHELKTPAASIQATAETLRQAATDDPEAVRRFAAQLEREAVRLSRIVADLLDLSRLESGSVLEEWVRLDALVREEAQRFEPAAKEAGLELIVDAPQTPSVIGSPRDLSLLIRNLVDNGIRYTPAEGRVEIRVWAEGPTVILSVQDTGVGIPSRDLPRIFERFYRVDRARSRETGGTGLGLAIVKHVVENHGGTVEVRSELGRGSTFEVHLPVGPSR